MIDEHKDQLFDIYDMWYEPFWSKTWFLYFIIFLIIIVFGSVGWYLYKKYIYRKDSVDCSKVALRDLDHLKKFHIATVADSKDCYFRLSLIIKNYLASRYAIASLQLTDKEIIAQAHHVMDEHALDLLKQVLQSMTLLKFERQKALNEKLEKDIQILVQFVQITSQDSQPKEI